MSYGFGKQYDKIEEEEPKKKNAVSSVFSATKQRPSNKKRHVNTKSSIELHETNNTIKLAESLNMS